MVNLIWLREVSLNGMVKLGMKVNWEFWKKHICSRIREVGKQVWNNGFNDTERERVCTNERMSKKLKFCRWECGGRSETDGERRMFASERE